MSHAADAPELRYQPGLDGMRAISVCAVIVYHLDRDLLPGGFIGVDVFFTLSGFLITLLLLAEFQRECTISLRAFYRRRVLRLYPALIVACVAGFVVAWWVYGGLGHAAGEAIAALTYTTNILESAGVIHSRALGHTWSLGVEEQFYLVWPLVLLVLVRHTGIANLPKYVGVILVSCVVLRAALVPFVSRGVIYVLPIGHLDDLAAGSLLAALSAAGTALKIPKLARSRLLALLASAALVLIAFRASIYHPDPLNYGGTTVIALATCFLIAHTFYAPDTEITRFLGSRPLRWLGRRSYGVYLYQSVIIIALQQGWHLRLLVAGPLAILVTVLVAAASYRYVERPFLRRKHGSGGPIIEPLDPRAIPA